MHRRQGCDGILVVLSCVHKYHNVPYMLRKIAVIVTTSYNVHTHVVKRMCYTSKRILPELSRAYMFPFQVPNFIESMKFVLSEQWMLFVRIKIIEQSLKDTHHLPLSCISWRYNAWHCIRGHSCMYMYTELLQYTYGCMVDSNT